jgi:hypothetical protein
MSLSCPVRAWVAVALVAAPLTARGAPADADAQQRVADGERLAALLSDVGPYRLIEATPDAYQLGLVGDGGNIVGRLRLERGHGDRYLRFRSRSFAVQTVLQSLDPKVLDRLVLGAHTLADRDDGSWTDAPTRQQFDGSRLGYSWAPEPGLTDAMWWFVAIALVLAVWRRGRISFELKLPHLLPATIQVLIFTYWSIYWPDVRNHLPSVAVQLVMAFAADAAFSYLRLGIWRVGAGPLPVILSANLFAWFNTTGVVVMILTAFGTKTFLRFRGRHLLNPSATGLAVAGTLAAIRPDVIAFGGVFDTMNAAPDIVEVIFLLSLIPQARFRIVPVSIGAVLALRALDNPTILRPSMLLALSLLATDPATIPKTELGKTLFGVFIGLTLPGISLLLRHLGRVDDFAKVIPIPFANALGPAFDYVGVGAETLAARVVAAVRRLFGRPPSPERVATRPRLDVTNALFVACWLLLIVPAMRDEKPRHFEASLHWTWGTPLVVRDADDVPRCASNAVFCQPFMFAQEAALWLDRLRAGDRSARH